MNRNVFHSLIIIIITLLVSLPIIVFTVKKAATIDKNNNNNSSSRADTYDYDSTTIRSSTTARNTKKINNSGRTRSNNNEGAYYIFLQRFPLLHTGGWIFHTEVLVCPRQNFTTEDQSMLDRSVASITHDNFLPMEESWWSTQSSTYCVELGYGGSPCTSTCCSVPHGTSQRSYPLNGRYAIIENADGTQKSLFLYGTGDIDGIDAYHAVCSNDNDDTNNHHHHHHGTPCWSRWSGTDYNPLFNNCNTFTSTVLSCVYGLSQKKPNLGPSDFVTVKCHCHPTTLGFLTEDTNYFADSI